VCVCVNLLCKDTAAPLFWCILRSDSTRLCFFLCFRAISSCSASLRSQFFFSIFSHYLLLLYCVYFSTFIFHSSFDFRLKTACLCAFEDKFKLLKGQLVTYCKKQNFISNDKERETNGERGEGVKSFRSKGEKKIKKYQKVSCVHFQEELVCVCMCESFV